MLAPCRRLPFCWLPRRRPVSRGNKSEAARLLDVDRKTLYKLLAATETEAWPGAPR
ncbi:helix-turn-helix domain-containing protein [Corallococcus terminator]